MSTEPAPDVIGTILERIGHDHWGMIAARDAEEKGSADWHRFDQGRWAFREAALNVARMAGRSTVDIYNTWQAEWTPPASESVDGTLAAALDREVVRHCVSWMASGNTSEELIANLLARAEAAEATLTQRSLDDPVTTALLVTLFERLGFSVEVSRG